MTRRPPSPTLFPYPTLSRSLAPGEDHLRVVAQLLGKMAEIIRIDPDAVPADKTRLEAEEVPFGPCRGEHVPHRHARSEEHTSELQSPCNLVCRLLLENKFTNTPMLVINIATLRLYSTQLSIFPTTSSGNASLARKSAPLNSSLFLTSNTCCSCSRTST